MDHFNCKGRLTIGLGEQTEDADVSFEHQEKHLEYWRIDVPEEVQKYISQNRDKTIKQVGLNNKLSIII